MILLDGVPVVPTMFPDKTSQVWKLDNLSSHANISWYYENESELIHLNQLIDLLESQDVVIDELYVPYMPYARQDKEVSNQTTFAKRTFHKMLFTENIKNLVTLDEHSHTVGSRWESSTDEMFDAVFDITDNCESPVHVYPDAGAYNRYRNILPQHISRIVFDKVRDQYSGKILGICVNKELSDKLTTNTNTFIIIDDICDGGRTFIETAKILGEKYPNQKIILYTTHGIYSKGLDVLFDAGISEVVTTDSLEYFRKSSPYDFSKLKVIT